MLSLLFKPRQLIAVIKLMRETSRQGVEVDDLPPSTVAAILLPKSHAERYGLVPDADVTTTPPDDDPAVSAVLADVRSGNWSTAADFVASTMGDWDRRHRIVWQLGDIAAKDDTWLEAWRAARPNDPHLAVVHASSLVSLAWDIRGSARAKHTSREQFDGFHRVLAEAHDAALAAAAGLPDDPTPWCTLLTLARGLSFDHDEFLSVWEQLTARDPLHLNGHHQALQYWCAKWSGSHEMAMQFALRAAESSPKFLGLPLVAASEMQEDEPAVWTSPRVVAALDLLLSRLADEGAGTTAVRSDRGYAILALMSNNRFEEAVGQFRMLGTHADAAPWGDFEEGLMAFLMKRGEAIKGARKAGMKPSR